jgi:hypothetical protein
MGNTVVGVPRSANVFSFRIADRAEREFYRKLADQKGIPLSELIIHALREMYYKEEMDPDPDMYWYGHA